MSLGMAPPEYVREHQVGVENMDLSSGKVALDPPPPEGVEGVP
jgi:hypothetical protein